ncbi:hypothetical protein [Patulibacter americanus]|uniref:hypothetical protein n=1 Tax=Patulibacter americanus TaxID=588672 RepID=UPI0003B64E20|nr:hypothetical protein [Patulibacter americanus]
MTATDPTAGASASGPAPPAPSRRLPAVTLTAAGVREGDPAVLGLLVERRGGAVVGYLREVTPPGEALWAAAWALADLRARVLTTGGAEFDPAAELLAATRRAATRFAENPLRPDGRRRTQERTAVCERIPRLLVSWAGARLPREDELRLLEHVRGCPDCQAANTAFARAETEFRDGLSPALEPAEAGALIAAMALASAG